MRKQSIIIRTIASEEDATDEIIHCDSHEVTYHPDVETFAVTFVNGVHESVLGEDVEPVTVKMTINKNAFIGVTVLEAPEPTVAIAAAELDELRRTALLWKDYEAAQADLIRDWDKPASGGEIRVHFGTENLAIPPKLQS